MTINLEAVRLYMHTSAVLAVLVQYSFATNECSFHVSVYGSAVRQEDKRFGDLFGLPGNDGALCKPSSLSREDNRCMCPMTGNTGISDCHPEASGIRRRSEDLRRQ